MGENSDKICPNCGAENETDHVFCLKCGKKLQSESIIATDNVSSEELPLSIATAKKSKKKIILFSIIGAIFIILAVFFFTRGSRDIVGVWESDVFTISGKGITAQEILVINDSGKGADITIDLKTGNAYDINTGRFDIKAFSCNFYNDSDKKSSPVGSGTKWTDYYGGDTVYNYNPITNHISSGKRVFSKTDKYQKLLDLVD